MDASAETGTQVWWTGKHITKVLIPHELVPSSLDKLFDLVEIKGVDLAIERKRQLTTTRANQTTWPIESSKLAPEVAFSPFRALSRRKLTFLLLNPRNKERQQISYNFFQYTTSFYRFYLPFHSMDTGVLLSFLSLLLLLSVIILVDIISSIIIITVLSSSLSLSLLLLSSLD